MSRTVTGRFAPTPSGRMHAGNIFSALLAWLSVRSAGGNLLLRIEDLDALRCPKENVDVLKADLLDFGLNWDSEQPNQSESTAYYEEVLETLRKTGKVYPCWCTHGDLKNIPNAPHASDGHPIYPGTCRLLSAQKRKAMAARHPPLWRLAMPDKEISFKDGHLGIYTENPARECGDIILRRADGVFAYQLAVVADDIRGGVNQVVRGADLLSSTPRQLVIYDLLGAEAPQFFHGPLLTAPDGQRLSKRDKSLDIGVLRQRYTPQEIIGHLSYRAGLLSADEPCTPEELIPLFSWDKISREECLQALYD